MQIFNERDARKIEERKWCLYVHINKENNKKYFGITSKDPIRRWSNGSGYTHNPHFYSAIQKYGWDGFDHVVLIDNLTCEEAKILEEMTIATWNTIDPAFGYNMTLGGDGTRGCHPSEETKKKLSECRRRENLSDETIRRRSESLRARRLSEDHKRKIGIGNSKAVNMYELDGTFIKSFDSMAEAESETHISHSHISQCCNQKRKSTGGYRWAFA